MTRTRQDRLAPLIDALERAGIHGRGGAGFPTATKLRAVAAQQGRPIVVVNAAEGEPLSLKDRYLMTSRVDTVFDGALAAAQALKADEVVIAIDERRRKEINLVVRALEVRTDFDRNGLKVAVRAIPSGYVSGQETALISALAGGEAKPTATPPYPFERGLRGRPTFVSNAETYSQIGRVARGDYDGTRLLTVAGAVARPGLVEIMPETTIASVLQTAGGISENVHGVLLGGYGGTWARIDEVMQLPLDEWVLRGHHLTLGAGIVFLLGDSSCPVAEVARVSRWMAAQSAAQCGPCIHGLGAIADALEELTLSGDRLGAYGQIGRWSELVKKRGACAHPDGVARFVTTALDVFGGEFDHHARRGACERCVSGSVFPLPRRGRDLVASRGPRTRSVEADLWGLRAAR